ncbi:MAG TPA: ATP-binding protein [Bacteroidota bacterium]|nr:ATP-binding protein [Bacteroidota bacterium]
MFRTTSDGQFEPYVPFIHNLANFVALSLENRRQHILLEKNREELEDRVTARTAELYDLNTRIQTLNQELEQRVTRRTAQLEATNKELEAFAYSVSHDLRAPLRGIDGFSQVLLEEYKEKLDEQGKEYLHRVRLAAQRMGQLIDDMLNLSRVNHLDMKIQQVNLSELVRVIAAEFQATHPERDVEFLIQDRLTTKGDKQLLRLVLENLVGNALKFTSTHPTARIEFGLELQRQGTPAYFVRDDGVGFEMKYAQKLFGAFQRLHSTTEFPGTGIGLATVQRIVHRHGGSVWAEGKVEEGATIWFSLPPVDS